MVSPRLQISLTCFYRRWRLYSVNINPRFDCRDCADRFSNKAVSPKGNYCVLYRRRLSPRGVWLSADVAVRAAAWPLFYWRLFLSVPPRRAQLAATQSQDSVGSPKTIATQFSPESTAFHRRWSLKSSYILCQQHESPASLAVELLT